MKQETGTDVKEYICQQCGYIYSPEKGDRRGKIPPGVSFEDLPEDYTCPLCGARKSRFAPMLD